MLCTDYDKIVLCCWYFVSWLFLAMVPAVLIKEVQRCLDEGEGGEGVVKQGRTQGWSKS